MIATQRQAEHRPKARNVSAGMRVLLIHQDASTRIRSTEDRAAIRRPFSDVRRNSMILTISWNQVLHKAHEEAGYNRSEPRLRR